MESTRRELYTIRGKLYLEMGDDYYNEFKKKYKNYSDWFQKEFESMDRASDTLSIYNNDMFEPDMSLRDFIKKYACDLEWAKDTEYCKVTPEAPKPGITPVTGEDRSKIINEKFSEYPCLHDLPLYLNRKADGTMNYFLYFEVGEYKALYYPKGYVIEDSKGNKQTKKYQCPKSSKPTSEIPTSDSDVDTFLANKVG